MDGGYTAVSDGTESFALVDPFKEVVGEIKLEAMRVKSRITVIKAFNEHLRKTRDNNVRAELSSKISGETSRLQATLTKISDIVGKWSPTQKGHVSELLEDVLNEYRGVLETHKNETTEQLQLVLKEASRRDPTETDIEAGATPNGTVSPDVEDLQVTIEELYTQVLQSNRSLQQLSTMFPDKFDSLHDDNSERELSAMMQRLHTKPVQRNSTIAMKKKIFLVALASLLLIVISMVAVVM